MPERIGPKRRLQRRVDAGDPAGQLVAVIGRGCETLHSCAEREPIDVIGRKPSHRDRSPVLSRDGDGKRRCVGLFHPVAEPLPIEICRRAPRQLRVGEQGRERIFNGIDRAPLTTDLFEPRVAGDAMPGGVHCRREGGVSRCRRSLGVVVCRVRPRGTLIEQSTQAPGEQIAILCQQVGPKLVDRDEHEQRGVFLRGSIAASLAPCGQQG